MFILAEAKPILESTWRACMDHPDPTTLTRQQIYELIWKEPTRTVAQRLGVSDVGLAKTCRKLLIPRPWRGYWREKETGHRPKQPKLTPWPAHLGKEPEAITFRAVASSPSHPRPPEPETVQQQRVYEASPDHQIEVSGTLTDPHRLIRRAERLLKRPGERDLLRPSEWQCLDIHVSKESLNRALRIFDAILTAVNARGWSVSVRSEHPFLTQVTVLGEPIAICITEKMRQIELPQPPKKDLTFLIPRERFRYESTGLLTIRLSDSTSFTWNPRTWNDGKRQRLESCLHDVMIGFVELAERRKSCHVPIVNSYLLRFPVHLVLDESHRIKAGSASQRGSAAASVSHLARRRDILSGTPLPQGLGDLEAQLEFLWPSQGISTRVLAAGRPRDVLAPYYVRTTKSELHLGPVIRHYEQVMMTDAQVALYGLVRDALLRREAGLRAGPTMDELDLAKRSVLSLLQICSNPILLARRLGDSATLVKATDRQVLSSILGQVIEDGDSPKIVRACQRALSLAAEGRKVVVWSAFTDTVERVATVLAQVGATYIHGGVNTGSIDDPATREARVAAFNDANSSTMVLVANPAACSEGISLHRNCGNAIYVDRSFNAAHFLQSVDRIHRLGIVPEDRPTHIEILEAITPAHLGSVDFSVRRRLRNKLETMAGVLEDPDLRQLALDEGRADAPTTDDVTLQDILDVIEQLRGRATDPGEEPL